MAICICHKRWPRKVVGALLRASISGRPSPLSLRVALALRDSLLSSQSSLRACSSRSESSSLLVLSRSTGSSSLAAASLLSPSSLAATAISSTGASLASRTADSSSNSSSKGLLSRASWISCCNSSDDSCSRRIACCNCGVIVRCWPSFRSSDCFMCTGLIFTYGWANRRPSCPRRVPVLFIYI